jgi:hypothetical protein
MVLKLIQQRERFAYANFHFTPGMVIQGGQRERSPLKRKCTKFVTISRRVSISLPLLKLQILNCLMMKITRNGLRKVWLSTIDTRFIFLTNVLAPETIFLPHTSQGSIRILHPGRWSITDEYAAYSKLLNGN